ncbi:uncharacterized protein LOC122303018 isoform X2 [Carya illinoinensis]|uniref:uncharacterized protein LOC122303018 isoform X2 n=1 Tax=Carya illinoinensis TaxID=32201 RepID=UPI001C728F65|nr:uncharacterized protein LOC122303018 isoform X2 [Carya illinoinensis]
MENITASELAGFGVGTLLVCVTIAAPRIDAFISASQRRLTNFSSGKSSAIVLVLKLFGHVQEMWQSEDDSMHKM